MTLAQNLASFVVNCSYEDLSPQVVNALKIRIADSIGCAIGAIGSGPVGLIRRQVEDFGGTGKCSLIGGGSTAPDRAAFYNSALIRFLDFNDSFLAKNETCHPSDNLGSVLAASEYADRNGRDLLVALAVAYQVQCRLSEVAPVRQRGFDHVTQGSFALAAGVSKALGLDVLQTANALGICGTAFNALRVTRTGALSNWKGLAYPNSAFCATHGTFLAMRGVTGPLEVFEGNKGFMDAISGPFEIRWAEEVPDKVLGTILKKYNAEIHSQSTIEGAMELKNEQGFTADQVEKIEIETFDVAYHIIGGGEEGDKTIVRTKEQADHSLQYMVAVALLDDAVMPAQYDPERISKPDVQNLLRRITVQPSEEFSMRFPQEVQCRITVFLKEGRTISKRKSDYEGFHTRPMSWDAVTAKFNALAAQKTDSSTVNEIIDMIRNFDRIKVKDFAGLLTNVGTK